MKRTTVTATAITRAIPNLIAPVVFSKLATLLKNQVALYSSESPAQFIHYEGGVTRSRVHTRKNDSHSPGRRDRVNVAMAIAAMQAERTCDHAIP